MIILDTDVVSAVMRPARNPAVIRWLNDRSLDDLFVTAITVFEILSGIEAMEKGRRRADLETAFGQALGGVLGGRVLQFDEAAARVASNLYGWWRENGITIGAADTQIAGIAVSRGAALATGNVRHFPALSVPVINPWQAE